MKTQYLSGNTLKKEATVNGFVYVSYSTPIARIENGQFMVSNKDYSVTTACHFRRVIKNATGLSMSIKEYRKQYPSNVKPASYIAG